MLFIKKIENKKNENGIVEVTFSDDSVVEIYEEIALKLGFSENEQAEEETVIEAVFESRYCQAKNAALNKLRNKSSTKLEISEYLYKMNFDEAVVNKTIEFLEEYRLIDDEAYAKEYTEKAIQKGRGKQRIFSELVQKGISQDTAEESIESCFDSGAEENNALREAKKKMAQIGIDEKTPFAVGRYLASKGYEEELIRKILNRLFNSFEEY